MLQSLGKKANESLPKIASSESESMLQKRFTVFSQTAT